MSETAKTSVLAIVSLVLGVISIFGGSFVTAIPAIICGHLAVSKIKNSEGGLKGKGMALAGLIIGYVGLALFIFLVVVMGLFADDVHSELEREIQRMESMEQPVLPEAP